MVKLDANTFAHIRSTNPNYDRDCAMLEAAARDCAIAYFWNPIVSPNEFEYTGWSTTLYGGIDHANRTAYIVFRGTDQLIDWMVNCFFIPLPLGHPLAHAGFILTWKIAKRRLVPWLRTQVDGFDKVVISGHSLGGALALAGAYELESEGFKVERCITVGAPRVYTCLSRKMVEEKLGDRVIRCFRRQDVVSKVPPELLGFRHVGKEWIYVGELFGEREAEPLSALGPWLAKAWHYATGGQLGAWLWQQDDWGMILVWPLYLIAVVGSLGGAFALLKPAMEGSYLFLLATTLAFAVMYGVLVALTAHRSGKYAATRDATSLIEEWQLYYLRKIAAGQKLASAGNGKVYVQFPAHIKVSHGDDRKRRLVRSFLRFFGEYSFFTPIGQFVQQALMISPNGRASAFLKSLPLDRQFEAVGAALQLFGYGSEDIDLMLEDGIIRRPKNWSRYYSSSNDNKAQAASEVEQPGTQ